MHRRRFLQLSAGAFGSLACTPLLRVAASVPGSASTPAPHHQLAAKLDPYLPLHPALQYGAIMEPNKRVRIHVQMKTKSADGKSLASSVGATHLEEFSFIKTHHMELPQKVVLVLAKHKDVLYISPDAAVQRHAIPASALQTVYPIETNAIKIWNDTALPATGAGVTVAVLDSGVNPTISDLGTNVTSVNVNNFANNGFDGNGHGTHVIGIIKGRDSLGNYVGIAPNANIISIKVSDDTGAAHTADLLRGLQWCFDNRLTSKIQIVNVSMGAAQAESYRTSPICAAVEQLWFNGVVVVVAAGNRGPVSDSTWYAPGNDPYVISVGAVDDNGTADLGDDTVATFSSRGKTQDLIYKPDIMAPGRKIYSVLAGSGCTLAGQHPAQIAGDVKHLRLSGTSMATPVVSGSVALLLERYPNLKPDQVKWLLQKTMRAYGAIAPVDGVGLLDAYAMMQTAAAGAVGSGNQGLTPNNGIVASGGSGTVATTAYWDTAYWDTAYWDTSVADAAADYD